MADKKSKSDSPEDELVKRVDAMMDPKGPDSNSLANKSEPSGPPPLDIFKDAPAPVAEQAAPKSSDDKLEEQPAPEESELAEAEPAEQKSDKSTTPENAVATDVDTDKAVDDIVAQEGDTVLAVEDAINRKANTAVVSTGGNWKDKFRAFLKNRWTWVGVVVIILALFAVPLTRYKLLGLVIKKPALIQVIDSKTNTPVSNAVVRLGGATAKTDANGKVRLQAAVGNDTLTVTKQYFKTYQGKRFVGFKSSGQTGVKLVATGRQVPITVVDRISGKPLANAEIKVLNTNAKTDSKGRASIVLPATAASDQATVSHSGFNTATIAIQVTSQKVQANIIQLTPSGHIYFLSNLNGTIDVVKTNLDGTQRKVVLAGTGKEEAATTSLLASRDWRYLVLKARRDTAKPALYLIDTSNDKVTPFEQNSADITLIGWYGHDFMYDLTRDSVSAWQSGHEQIKSYDADRSQLNQLDQDQADGPSTSYAYQSFNNFYITGNILTYTAQWFTYTTGAPVDLTGKTDVVRAIQPNGSGKKDYQSWPSANLGYIQAVLHEPQAIYYAVYTSNDNKTTYYNFENQSVKVDTNIDQSDFNKVYPTYLISPSGSQAFWTELRDGKNTLFTGADDASNPKQIAALSDYSPYGWFSDNYLLVSKNSSELYVMPVSGPASHPPLKVTDYYKPPTNFNGYGYGYGGL